MLKKAVPNGKRWVSGYLAALITLMLIFNNSFALSALAAETASGSNAQSAASASDAIKNSKVTLKNSPKDDVQIFVYSENNDYQPGETVCLELYIKNNTDKRITDGLLRYKGKGIEQDSAYFEDLNDFYIDEEETAEEETETAAEAEGTESEVEETEAAAETKDLEKENTESIETLPVESAEQTEETEQAAEKDPTAEAEKAKESIDRETIVEETEIEIAEKEAGEIDEQKKEEDKDSADDEEEESQDEEEEEDDDEPDHLEELELLPGKAYYVNFYYTIDSEIETVKDQKIDFTFTWKDEEDNRRKTATESFRYTVDGLNLLPVTVGGEKGWVETGKEDEMLLEFNLGMVEELLEEADMKELEKNPDALSTSSNVGRSTASNALISWDTESSDRPLGKKDPAVVKNLKCQVETFGLKLDQFKVVPVEEDDNYGTSIACRFYVSRKTAPGTYYGKVDASYKIKGKSYHTSQGFKVVVKQETGEIELTGKAGDAEIIMTGPVEAFPKADDLALKVSEVTEEQQELVDEALQKKAEEEGAEITKYKALDIKLLADGVETEPEGNVQVRFKNVNMEDPEMEKEKEESEPEGESAVMWMMNKVKSVFTPDKEAEEKKQEAEEKTEEKAETSAEEAKEKDEEEEKTEEVSENIKVLHLDENEVVANEMTSEVQENGDIVMDTDHFSIYVIVDMGKPGGQINVTVEHWAAVSTIVGINNNGELMPGDVDDATDPTIVDNDKTEFIEKNVNGRKVAEVVSSGGQTFGNYMRDQIYNRHTQKINMREYLAQEIYTPDTDIKIPNEKKIDKIEVLSKVSTTITGTIKNAQEKGYRIKEIWVTSNQDNLGQVEWKDYTKYLVKTYDANDDAITTENGEQTAITLKEDSIIRFVYEETEPKMVYFPVKFYDHNVSDGTTKFDEKGMIKAPEKGLNQKDFFKYPDDTERAKIGVGQESSGNTSSWQDGIWFSEILGKNVKLNAGNKNVPKSLAYSIPGIVKDELTENYSLQFDDNINYPDFFKEQTYKDYEDGGKTKYASKECKGYELGFRREGDTYFLTSVKNPRGEEKLKNLDDIRYSTRSIYSEAALFSNEFWPLDDVDSYAGMDHVEPKRSDGEGTHNWHFGMRYDFDFTVGDYKGPMNFYFRGDDDFWMFVDRKKVIDIGGIHSAAGKAVDMRKWLEKNGGVEGTHHVTIYFMERGGAGSCCYMQYTLPNCTSVDIPEVPTTNLTVKKRWADPNDFLRPDKIQVELLRKVKGDEEFTLIDDEEIEPVKELGGIGDIWECSWTMLPKVNPNNPSEEYIYKVQEKDVKGYIASYEYTSNGTEISEDKLDTVNGDLTCTITNTLSPKVKVKVVKTWEDDDNKDGNRPENVIMQLQYKKADESDDKYLNYPGDNGVVTLDGKVDTERKSAWEDKEWEGVFENLPYYADGKTIVYRVRELKKEVIDGKEKFIVLNDKEKLPGYYDSNSNNTANWNYTVTYEDAQDFPDSELPEGSSKPTTELEINDKVVAKTTVTNTFSPKTTDRYVMKNWEGVPSGVSPTAKIGLFVNEGTSNNKKWVLKEDFVKMDGNNIMDANNCITWAKEGEQGASNEKQKFILSLTYNSELNKLCQGGWKNLPEYKNGVKIEYGIFEIKITDSGEITPIILSEQQPSVVITINDCKYEVTEGMKDAQNGDGTEKTPFIITNKYIPAELKITKTVNENDHANEPINVNYKFMIQLIQVTGNEETIYTTVALGHDETSKTVYLTPTAAGEVFKVKEIIPMEYGVKNITIRRNGAASEEIEKFDDGSSSGVPIYPGDKIEFIVENEPTHKEYFHHTASATNEKSGDNFTQKVTYKEMHGKDKPDQGTTGDASEQNLAYVDLSAIVEDKETKWKEREWGEGVAIYG